jgi:hypothetical protein
MSDFSSNGETPDDSWPENYFNYYTEIEEHFREARGTALFLLSPLDWALIENWKNAGVPLEAVLKGIDETFDKWRGRKIKSRRVNSLAYCTQEVMEAAQRLSGAGARKARESGVALFRAAEIRAYLEQAASGIASSTRPAYNAIASSVYALAADAEKHVNHLEDLERHLTALEDKMVAIARSVMTEEDLVEMRRQLDSELALYRGKMTVDQIVMLERRYLDSRLLEKERLPRLSLFYMR